MNALYAAASVLGLTVMVASIVVGLADLEVWPFALAGLIAGLCLWLLGDIGGRLARVEMLLRSHGNDRMG